MRTRRICSLLAWLLLSACGEAEPSSEVNAPAEPSTPSANGTSALPMDTALPMDMAMPMDTAMPIDPASAQMGEASMTSSPPAGMGSQSSDATTGSSDSSSPPAEPDSTVNSEDTPANDDEPNQVDGAEGSGDDADPMVTEPGELSSDVDAGAPLADPDAEPELDSGAPLDPFAGKCAVQPLTAEFRQAYDQLDPFYQKYADANGIPVVSSDQPADEALVRACQAVIDMLSARDDVRQVLIDRFVRFAIIAENELTNDIPEFSYLDDAINERARGLGGVPAASCAEESILCNRQLDRWRGEGICVHEFAHTISIAGLYVADPTFEDRLTQAYDDARAAGLFENTYAMENPQEYWAEGVQAWYYTNLESDPPNGIHNWVDRREELEEYDPALYALVAELLPDDPQYVDCYSDE